MNAEPRTNGTDEDLARAIHARYVAFRRNAGETPETNAALADWDDLPGDLQESNRDQARDIRHKLTALDRAAVPATDAPADSADPADEFTADEFETLARMEHRRWVDHRRGQGWVYGPVRDEKTRQHPDLTEWTSLSRESQDKDRSAVRAIPELLRTAGLRIVRNSQ